MYLSHRRESRQEYRREGGGRCIKEAEKEKAGSGIPNEVGNNRNRKK